MFLGQFLRNLKKSTKSSPCRILLYKIGPLDHPATQITPWDKTVSQTAQEGGGWLTWVFSTEDISPIETKFGRCLVSKIVIADTDQLAESWFKSEILGALDTVTIDWIDPSANDGDNVIVAMHLSTPNGSVVLE